MVLNAFHNANNNRLGLKGFNTIYYRDSIEGRIGVDGEETRAWGPHEET